MQVPNPPSTDFHRLRWVGEWLTRAAAAMFVLTCIGAFVIYTDAVNADVDASYALGYAGGMVLVAAILCGAAGGLGILFQLALRVADDVHWVTDIVLTPDDE